MAAVSAAKTVGADVELAGLIEDLVAAGPIAVDEAVKLFTETLPKAVTGLVSTGRFAHLVSLAANVAYIAPLTMVAPFIVAVRDNLPLPLGTPDGVIDEAYALFIATPVLAAVTIFDLFASVIDDGLAPFDAVVGALNALSVAVESTVTSIHNIVGVLTGALPVVALKAPQEVARSQDVGGIRPRSAGPHSTVRRRRSR